MPNIKCGMPEDWFVRDKNGKKVCPECLKLSLKKVRCMGADCKKMFYPGCKIRFHCLRCFSNNKNKYD